MAVEDALSEAVLRRVLTGRPVRYEVGAVYGHRGFGYLKTKAGAFNNAARACPFLLLTDLDNHGCPPELVTEWLSGQPKHDSFLFRVAVREVESWLLGDMANLKSFLHVRGAPTLAAPEALQDPKQELLRLSVRSRVRQTRDALVWRDKNSGRLLQGPDYNGTLARFVAAQWNITTARRACPSLTRLFIALQRLEAMYV
jgi:hypothetical protein